MENWGTTQPKKSLYQRMKNKITRKKTNQPKKSFFERIKNKFTKTKKVYPINQNNMKYNTKNRFPTTASDPSNENLKYQKLIEKSRELYDENHPRTGFTAPLARKSRKLRK
jgi:hypothetical protein